MAGNLFNGMSYLARGVSLLRQPGIRHYVWIPLCINILLFSLLIYSAYSQVNLWIAWLLDWLPGWLSFVDWLLWLIFALFVMLLVVFGFSLLANLIAAPFNAFLAEAVERHLTGRGPQVANRSLAKEVSASLGRELVKIAYYLPRALGLLLLGFIPLINLAAPFLWLLLGAWMMAIQYLDYPMDNHRTPFSTMRQQLRARSLTTLGFGGTVLMMSLIPLLNLIVMPASVAAATACWVDEFSENSQPVNESAV